VQIHLRYDNPDGTQKDWIGEANQFGVNIQWGRRGQVSQGMQIPADRCHPTPHDELHRRANKKILKGYRKVSQVTDANDSHPTPSPEKVSRPPKAAKALAEWTRKTDTGPSWF